MSGIQNIKLPKTTLRWLQDSPFEPVAAEVCSTLFRGGYASRTIAGYLSCIAHFSHWCFTEKILINSADLLAVNRFIDEHLPVCHCAPRCSLSRHEVGAALQQWLNVATKLAVIKVEASDCPALIRVELMAVDRYLNDVRGLAVTTRNTLLKHVELFLRRQFGDNDVSIVELTPADITRYVETYCKGWKPVSVKKVCGSLRCYFQFKAVCGMKTDRLVASLPKIANWSLSGLPKSLSDNDVSTLLGSFDQDSLGGRRDYAIARCYVDLGLRTAEIVRLQLDDIDWHRGVLTVRGKGRRVDVLPLPEKTGQAIVCYLRHRSSEANSRSVFLRLRPPYHEPAVSDTIRGAIRNAAKRCGLSARISGPHRFRHTLATRLVQTGASLKDVSDLLRHRNLDTTTIYAKVNTEALLEVASPWPGAQS